MLAAAMVFLTVLTIVGILLSPWIVPVFAYGFKVTPGKLEMTTVLNRIMFAYIGLISISALAMGVLQQLQPFCGSRICSGSAESQHHCVFISFRFLLESCDCNGRWRGRRRRSAGGDSDSWTDPERLAFPLDLGSCTSGRAPRGDVDGRRGCLRIGIVHIDVLVGSQFAAAMIAGSAASITFADRVMELVLGGYVIALSTAILPLLSRQAWNGESTS